MVVSDSCGATTTAPIAGPLPSMTYRCLRPSGHEGMHRGLPTASTALGLKAEWDADQLRVWGDPT